MRSRSKREMAAVGPAPEVVRELLFELGHRRAFRMVTSARLIQGPTEPVGQPSSRAISSLVRSAVEAQHDRRALVERKAADQVVEVLVHGCRSGASRTPARVRQSSDSADARVRDRTDGPSPRTCELVEDEPEAESNPRRLITSQLRYRYATPAASS